MWKKAVVAVVSLVSFSIQAAPFAVVDVVAGVAQCGVYLDAAPKATIPATALQCKYDLSTVSAGAHSIKMTAISIADPVWGTQESAQTSPLAFSRPVAPAVPTGLVLTP